MIFTEQENQSRRQFHELFCTKYLYTGKARGALNENSWTSDTLYDILRNVYEGTILTPQDIETILQIGGMYDADGKLFFHYREETPVIKEILYAMSPFITESSYIRLKQRLASGSNNSSDSIATFVKLCCTNTDIEPEKIPLKQLYEYYSYWCALNRELVTSKRVFSRRLSELGFSVKKGYVNGDSGILYAIIRLDKEEVNKDAQQERTQAEAEEELDGAKSLRDVHGTGAEVLKHLVEGETSSLQEDEGGEDTSAVSRGSNGEHEEDDGNHFTVKPVIYGDVKGGITEDADSGSVASNAGSEDNFDWSSEDTDTEDGDDSPAEVNQAGAGQIVIPVFDIFNRKDAEDFVRTLPYNIRMAFKQMKITYRIAPDEFEQEEFENVVRSLGINNVNMDDLFKLFLTYASVHNENI